MAIDRRIFLAAAIAATVPRTAFAHGDAKKPVASVAKAEQKPFGIAGDPKAVTRTVSLDMTDEMRYFPASLDIRVADTVRFGLRNKGKTMHELVIGTGPDLQEHAALMKKFPGMEHDQPYMAHVKAGSTGELAWHFNRPGQFKYACLIAGHFDAGMVGTVTVA